MKAIKICRGIILLALILMLFSCNSTDDKIHFKSNWDAMNDRTWAGPDYWANPLQDWQVRDGKLECIRQGADRNVHLLTHQLAPESNMQVSVVVSQPVEDFSGWVGIRFACRGLLDEYRHNTINSTMAMDAILREDGTLVLKDDSVKISWPQNAELLLKLTPSGEKHLVELSVKGEKGKVLGQVQAEYPSGELSGNLALVCHSNQEKPDTHGKPVVSFEELKIKGSGLRGGESQRWGPILWSQYTVDRGILKLSAQFPPIGIKDSHQAFLEINRGEAWEQIVKAEIDDMARVALFRIEKWDESVDVPYRVAYHLDGEDHYWYGIVRRNPVDKEELTVAGFTGNMDYGFPNTSIIENLEKLDPDLLFFSGDQIYEQVARYGIVRSPVDMATLDYLRKWYLFGWSFGNLLNSRPSVIIPDDHDVYQGNVWGQGGRPIPKGKRFEYGGYVMDPEWVNMIQRTQTVHLPDPFDPTPVEQGITVYYTDLDWGNVSFAIVEDRKFKTGPSGEEGKNPETAVMLGERQHEFLNHWVEDWEHCSMKATLTQTVFAQCHTHGGSLLKRQTGDRDANGWPAEQRNEALRIIRKGFAFMLAGDNHLPTVVHHGIDSWEDAGVSFTVPSIAAGFPRGWWPDRAAYDKFPGGPDYYMEMMEGPEVPDYVGRFKTIREHPITMLAAANPEEWAGHYETTPGDIELLQRKRSGFGLVRFNTVNRTIAIECYPVLAKIEGDQNDQYEGWPVVIDQKVNYYRKPLGYLQEVSVEGDENPVIKVFNEDTGELIYALRLQERKIQPWVFEKGTYKVELGYPATGLWKKYNKLTIQEYYSEP
jgi:alkaline phosphatase D